jgi:hypothetical protein
LKGRLSILALLIACTACNGATIDTTTMSVTLGTTTTLIPTTTQPTSDVPEGFELFESADGFQVSLPSRWVPLDLSVGDLEAVLDELGESMDPETIEFIRESLASGVDFSLFAIDIAGDPNVNVIVVPRTPLETPDNLEDLLPVQLEELLGVTILSTDRVEHGGLDGVRIAYLAEFPDGVAEGHQYYMVGDDSVFIFSFTSFDPDSHRDDFPRVMETFRPTG